MRNIIADIGELPHERLHMLQHTVDDGAQLVIGMVPLDYWEALVQISRRDLARQSSQFLNPLPRTDTQQDARKDRQSKRRQ